MLNPVGLQGVVRGEGARFQTSEHEFLFAGYFGRSARFAYLRSQIRRSAIAYLFIDYSAIIIIITNLRFGKYTNMFWYKYLVFL